MPRPPLSFSLATNFDEALLEGLEGTPVDTLYGRLDPDTLGGGRASFSLPSTSRRRVEAHIREAARRGLGFQYLMNGACTGNLEQTRAGQRRIDAALDWVASLPVTGITVASPYLLRRIKRRYPRLHVRISVFAQVDRVAKARMWESLGADSIVLDSLLVNRDFAALEAIRGAVSLDLELLATNQCLLDCALSPSHMTSLAHASGCGGGGAFVDWCFLSCGSMRLEDPSRFLRADWIRPEDLDRYRALGFHRFKLTERGAPTEVLLRRVRAYAAGRYDGNLLDLIRPFGYREPTTPGRWGRLGELLRRGLALLWPGALHPRALPKLARLAKLQGLLLPLEGDPVHVDNRALDGFLAGWPRRGCRQRSCDDCGYCARWAEKAVRIDAGYRDEVRALYREILDDAETGALWLGRAAPAALPQEVV